MSYKSVNSTSIIDLPSAAPSASHHTATDSKRFLYLTRERSVALGTNHRRLLEWDPLARHCSDSAQQYYPRGVLPVTKQLKGSELLILHFPPKTVVKKKANLSFLLEFCMSCPALAARVFGITRRASAKAITPHLAFPFTFRLNSVLCRCAAHAI